MKEGKRLRSHKFQIFSAQNVINPYGHDTWLSQAFLSMYRVKFDNVCDSKVAQQSRNVSSLLSAGLNATRHIPKVASFIYSMNTFENCLNFQVAKLESSPRSMCRGIGQSISCLRWHSLSEINSVESFVFFEECLPARKTCVGAQ